MNAKRTKPDFCEKNDAEALRWLAREHCAPCGDPKCDSAYCYLAERITGLLAQLGKARREQDEASALANRWIQSALALDPPSGLALSFDPTNPEAFTASRAPVLLDLIESRTALRTSEARAARLTEALERVALGKGPFSMDALTFAENVIEESKRIAREALAAALPSPTEGAENDG